MVVQATILAGASLAAQQSTGTRVPMAPVPAQILAAKKVFISNGPGELFTLPVMLRMIRTALTTYNQLYASLKNWVITNWFLLLRMPI